MSCGNSTKRDKKGGNEDTSHIKKQNKHFSRDSPIPSKWDFLPLWMHHTIFFGEKSKAFTSLASRKTESGKKWDEKKSPD